MQCKRRRHAYYVANSWYATTWNKKNGCEHYVDNYSVQANCSSCRTCGKATLFVCKRIATRELIFIKLILDKCQAEIWGSYIGSGEHSGLLGYGTMDCIFTLFRWTLCTQISLFLTMEAASSSETPVTVYKSTERNIAEDISLNYLPRRFNFG